MGYRVSRTHQRADAGNSGLEGEQVFSRNHQAAGPLTKTAEESGPRGSGVWFCVSSSRCPRDRGGDIEEAVVQTSLEVRGIHRATGINWEVTGRWMSKRGLRTSIFFTVCCRYCFPLNFKRFFCQTEFLKLLWSQKTQPLTSSSFLSLVS